MSLADLLSEQPRIRAELAAEYDAHRRQELALAMLMSVQPTDRALAGWSNGLLGKAMLRSIARGQEVG